VAVALRQLNRDESNEGRFSEIKRLGCIFFE
jgi:hypothetical protein